MDLTITEAWALWWSGQQLTEHSIHGMSVLWAARTGKLLAFLAGTTIVLDIIGSERLVAWGNRVGKSGYLVVAVVLLFPIGVLVLTETVRPGEWLLENYPPWVLWLTMAAFMPLIWWAMDRIPIFSMKLVVKFGRMLANQKFERWLRTIAVPLFFLGFALDYLAF
ncbi:hypothetical protein ACIRPH_31375 [Nocardiopsis sp. NPDC101807]|uniref:hypothetical protein n=1 Tax=Nocardiopsis sp. NPDC101807 TaxID=3364339 RepID=UPI0037F5FA11